MPGADSGEKAMRRSSYFAAVLAVLASMAMAAPAAAEDAPDPAGDWNGALTVPSGQLTLILHVAKDATGALSATLESPDQGPGSMPASEIAVKGTHMTWKVASIGASYSGDWDAAKAQWSGAFSQGADLPLTLSRGLPQAKPVIEGLDGQWDGSIAVNGVDLRLVLRVFTGGRGTTASLDSPDQLARGIQVTGLTHEGSSVSYDVPMVKGHYAGVLSADGSKIEGTWTQPGVNAPLTFALNKDAARNGPPPRPQTPTPPFPYKSEDVAFDNPVDQTVHLAGTLTLPKGKGPFPAAVLITGSGAQDRDETLLGHKPFAVIADYLTRHGIAVLRFDDRGVGKSTGKYAAATSADLATDANAAADYLMTRREIRHDAVGFIGHSEGGMIGPIAMADNDRIAFLIMLAGPGTALDKLMLSQRRLIGSQIGMSDAALDSAEPVMAAVFHAVADGATPQVGREAARAVLTPAAMASLGAPGADPDVVLNQVTGPWYSYFLKYDPAPNLRRIKVPLLALNGNLDRQVPPEDNLAAIRQATAGNPDATTIELPGLNHLFQTARTGAIGEYADIPETVAPVALETMTDWLTRRFVWK
jgi:pimeloyl-ACP methyl ester carboxylesterase